MDRDTGVPPVRVAWNSRYIGFPTFQPSARAGRPCQCAWECIRSEGCKSPPSGRWPLVTNCNCVAARRGGEQQEVKVRSVTQVNPIRPMRDGEPADKVAKPRTRKRYAG